MRRTLYISDRKSTIIQEKCDSGKRTWKRARGRRNKSVEKGEETRGDRGRPEGRYKSAIQSHPSGKRYQN